MRKIFILLLILFGANKLVYAQGFPSNELGDVAKKLVSVLQGEQDIKKYVSENFSENFLTQFPLDMHVQIVTMLRNDFGSGRVAAIKIENSNQINFIIENSGERVKIILHTSTEKNKKIESLGIVPGGTPSEANQKAISSFEDLDNYLKEEANNNRFSGVVSFEDNGKITFQKAYGFSARGAEKLNNIDTRFNLASYSKMFTTIGVLKLVEQGKINLNDNIGKYTSVFPEEISSKVTVLHLLKHQSGWEHYWDNSYFLENMEELATVDDYMKFIKDIPLVAEPGERFIYSNVGFEVLGHLIEQVSGKDYYEFIKENIFEVAEMNNTGYDFKSDILRNTAIGYTSDELIDNYDTLPLRGTPAGAAYSNAEDLLKFKESLRTNKLVSGATLNILFRDIFNLPDNQRRLALGGGSRGINMVMMFDLNQNDSIIILTNFDPPLAEDLIRNVSGLVD